MAKVIMTCGKICCGKSTYARKIKEETKAVILSIDDIMLTFFPEGAGEMHDALVLRAEQYLLALSIQITDTGTDAILDWGLWTREQRERIRQYYRGHGVETEMHYLRISRSEWEKRIRTRNGQHSGHDYYVDEGLIRKVERLFEEPSPEEVDYLIDETGAVTCQKPASIRQEKTVM